MGTKIQGNAFLRDYHPVIDLDGDTSTGLRSLNGHNLNSFTSRIYKNGSLGYETEKVRQTILEHESIFRNQLQELHRLYRRQRELMSEIKRRELSKSSSLSYLSNMEKGMEERVSKVPVFESTSQNPRFQASYDREAKSSISPLETSQCNNTDALRFGFHFRNTNNQNYLTMSTPTDGVSANSCSNFNLVTKDFMQDFSSGKKPSEPRKDILHCPLDLGVSVSRRKRKIFGVEIFEMNDDTFEATNEKVKVPYQSSESQTKQENRKGELPWFLKNAPYSGEPSNGTKSSYFMNIDSLQNCSENFFSKQKKETSARNEVNVNDGSGKKIFGFPISDMLNISNVNSSNMEGDKSSYISDLKHHIDLNLSLDEEDVPLTPSVPTAIIKIATTEIDLEDPTFLEQEVNILSKEVNFVVSCDESDKIAAEAIIAISLSQVKNSVDEPHNEVSVGRLKLLAEIVSSQCEDNDKEESIPSGMDYFEFMTLKLEDVKEKDHLCKPVILHNPSDDEAGSGKLPKRSRSRRGSRQRKDFQRDVLPGLVTLSRHQVTEDFQAFEEILKGEGITWQSGRGRKRLGGTTRKAQCATSKKQQAICEYEERSISGWGKRTRRLPRQRCTNSFLSFTVKC